MTKRFGGLTSPQSRILRLTLDQVRYHPTEAEMPAVSFLEANGLIKFCVAERAGGREFYILTTAGGRVMKKGGGGHDS